MSAPGDESTRVTDEEGRRVALLEAQGRAERLFEAVFAEGVIAPGVTDRQASDRIRDLAVEMFGVKRFWHKRIVRSGPNSLLPYQRRLTDRTMDEDDIAFIDFGPVFEGWEADFGRTVVLGEDPERLALRDALPVLFAHGVDYFNTHRDLTGEQLYAEVVRASEEAGWGFGGSHCGHLIGDYPHERLSDQLADYLTTGNTMALRRVDAAGNQCHWILEIHLVNQARTFGGFYEQLLDVNGPSSGDERLGGC